MKKRILLLATGGTIACVATEQGFVPGMSGEELLAFIPDLRDKAEFHSQQLMNIDSSEMQVSDWKTIARAIQNVADDYDAIVVTHGTDTMCYTAAALSFMLGKLKIPVLLTGAQKPSSVADSDGPENLHDVCRVAMEAEPGVAIVFNKKVIHGVRSFKMYSKNEDAYVSRNYPILAEVKRDAIDWHHPMQTLEGDRELYVNFCEEVMLLKLAPNTSPAILDYIARAGYRGLVIEGFGAGGIANLTRGMASGISKLINKFNIPVLMISQCPYDGVNLSIYGIGDQAYRLGVIPGNDMTTEVAVTKMMWALGQTFDIEKVREMLLTNYIDEISL